MRVITGFAKGKRLETLKGDAVRPTSDRVKEAVFSIVQFDIENSRFLDLFSGSGQIGIEALSRNAASVVFVDSSKEAIGVINRNLEYAQLKKNAIVLNMDSISFLKSKNDKFDIAFLDPPYKTGRLQEALQFITDIMKDNGTVICESSFDEKLPEILGRFILQKEYRYGKIKISVFRCKDE